MDGDIIPVEHELVIKESFPTAASGKPVCGEIRSPSNVARGGRCGREVGHHGPHIEYYNTTRHSSEKDNPLPFCAWGKDFDALLVVVRLLG